MSDLVRNTARTRRAILDAAERTFAASGGEASIARIAAAAGVSKSGLLHHFPTRQDLIRAVAVDGIDRFRSEVLAQVDLTENRPGKLLRAYVRAMCDPKEAITAAFAATSLGAVLRATPGVTELFAEDELRWRADLAADGLPIERVLLIRYGAEGVVGALSSWMIDPNDLIIVRSELLALAEPD